MAPPSLIFLGKARPSLLELKGAMTRLGLVPENVSVAGRMVENLHVEPNFAFLMGWGGVGARAAEASQPTKEFGNPATFHLAVL